MTSNFIASDHPRVAAGQFTEKVNSAPAVGLVTPTTSTWSIAMQQARQAEDRMYREGIREMRRLAPEAAETAVFELYSEGEPDELFAFQGYVDADGEDVQISRELHDHISSIGYSMDASADRFGFERDREMFNLPLADAPDDTAQRLEDAAALHANATPTEAPESIVVLNRAARERIQHVASTAGEAPFEATQLMFEWNDGDDMRLMAVRGAEGQIAQDFSEWDEAAWDELDFAATHINNPRYAGLLDTSARGTGHGPFVLYL